MQVFYTNVLVFTVVTFSQSDILCESIELPTGHFFQTLFINTFKVSWVFCMNCSQKVNLTSVYFILFDLGLICPEVSKDTWLFFFKDMGGLNFLNYFFCNESQQHSQITLLWWNHCYTKLKQQWTRTQSIKLSFRA